MTQEEKELLLIDLSARLPYGVVCEFKRSTLNVLYNNIYDDTLTINNIGYVLKDDSIVRPYLRPMSSMTKEEKKELQEIAVALSYNRDDIMIGAQINSFRQLDGVLNLFNSHHFDYRGLIPKGLALEAPEGMYKI